MIVRDVALTVTEGFFASLRMTLSWRDGWPSLYAIGNSRVAAHLLCFKGRGADFLIVDFLFPADRFRSVLSSRAACVLGKPFEIAQIRVDMADSVSIESRQRPEKRGPNACTIVHTGFVEG